MRENIGLMWIGRNSLMKPKGHAKNFLRKRDILFPERRNNEGIL